MQAWEADLPSQGLCMLLEVKGPELACMKEGIISSDIHMKSCKA